MATVLDLTRELRESGVYSEEWDEEGTIERLPVAQLLDYRDTLEGHQRAIVKRRVDELVKEWNSRARGILTVSRRQDGSLWLMDGQHRAAAMRRIGIKTTRCLVFDGLTTDEEKYLWALLNDTAPAKGNSLYHGLLGGDRVTQEIDEVVRACGYEVPKSPTNKAPNVINATGTLEWVYGRGGKDAVFEVLNLIRTAYPNNQRAVCAPMIAGLHVFVDLYRDDLNLSRVRRVLDTTPFDQLVQKANEFAQTSGRGNKTHFASAIFVLYNKGLREGYGRLDYSRIVMFSGGATKRLFDPTVVKVS